MSDDGQSSPPEVAIIGAGLAGLSAALTLRTEAKHARLNLFEKESRIGGRVLTSQRPSGEHGAEFVLRSEPAIVKILRSLGLGKSAPLDHGACRFEGHTARGSFRTMARHTLNARANQAVIRVFQAAIKANRSGKYPKGDKPGQWLNQRLRNDLRARRFLQMLLLGETCAPWNHLTGRHALGSFDESETYRIAGGSEQLVQALRRAIPEARLITESKVTSVRIDGTHASVLWSQNAHHYCAPFDAVIITAPDGERLLRQRRLRYQPIGHFHAYISVLLEYRQRWWARRLPELRDGLYTDGPLNFVEEVPKTIRGRHVLRILLPNAERWLSRTDPDIEALSLCHLRQLSKDAQRPIRCSIKRWPHGLPCSGSTTLYDQVSERPAIYLAGDRFAEWPSMSSALKSGQRAAKKLACALRTAPSQRLQCR